MAHNRWAAQHPSPESAGNPPPETRRPRDQEEAEVQDHATLGKEGGDLEGPPSLRQYKEAELTKRGLIPRY